jgi:hypothetical protein
MAAEYSFIPSQIVAEDANVAFMDGDRSCRKGFIEHRSGSGVFTIKGAGNGCRSLYRVTFNGNIAVAPADEGGVLGPISIALTENGEPLGNATAIISAPVAIGDLYNVSITTFVSLPCGCCKTVAVRNVSDGTAIEVTNANIIIDRVA